MNEKGLTIKMSHLISNWDYKNVIMRICVYKYNY